MSTLAKPVGLTVLALKALEPREQAYEVKDEAVTGAYVVVRPSGVLSYVVRYRFIGTSRKLTIGAFNPHAGGYREGPRAGSRRAERPLRGAAWVGRRPRERQAVATQGGRGSRRGGASRRTGGTGHDFRRRAG